jgi:hypothetical protein
MNELVEGFVACTLLKSDWTHAAHLRVALHHVHTLGEEAALTALRERISRLNVSLGGANTTTGGYHESLTRFWVFVVARFLDRHPGRSPESLEKELIAELGDTSLPRRCYSRELLMSTEARMSFVEPDLAPLSGLADLRVSTPE